MPTIRDYADIVSKGFIKQAAPSILQGGLVELLKDVSVAKASEWVNNNTRLWDYLESNLQNQLKYLAEKAGPLDWLTADWVLQAIRHDCPALASLFLGWRKGRNWFVRQVEQIRSEVEG